MVVTGQALDELLSPVGSFLGTSQLALGAFDFLFCLSQVTRVVDSLPSRQGGQSTDAKVDADGASSPLPAGGLRWLLRCGLFHQEGHVPPISGARDGVGLQYTTSTQCPNQAFRAVKGTERPHMRQPDVPVIGDIPGARQVEA